MLFVRVLMFLLLPLRLPFMLLGRLFRISRTRAGAMADRAVEGVVAAPTVGAVRRVTRPVDAVDVRTGVFFKIFTCPQSDEKVIGPNDLPIAEAMAQRARKFYSHHADLFPPDDIFYEEVEGHYIEEVTSFDNDGERDQFVHTLDDARKLTNGNTRTLYAELAPAVLTIVLVFHAAMLIHDPFNMLVRDNPIWSLEGAQVFAAEAALAAGSAGVGILLMAFVYWFSYSHIQRANALSLNVFITTEFARLNNAFRVAQREALQAETQLSDSQKEEIRRLSSSWTLAYHWIGVRQFLEEMFVRNVMFQIRRNTTLYRALGIAICLAIGAGLSLAVLYWAGLPASHTAAGTAMAHLAVVALTFMVITYGLTTRRPFAIVSTAQMKDQWYRYHTLSVGDAVAEQVTRDKVQIVINRDRARAAGA